jgi:uncharacterized membrane protein YebE (DUF533 family)
VSDDLRPLDVIRVWAATAWADGRLQPEEALAMDRLIAAAPLSDADRATARGFLDAPVELEADALRDLAPARRDGIYAAAVRLVHLDRSLAPSEAAFLIRLRRALGLDATIAAAIERAIR